MTDITHRAKRSLGQNFLVDRSCIDRIIAAARLSPADTVIEVGPGRGALTERLVGTGANVIAIELDRDLIAPLRKRFAENANFRVVEADILDVDLEELTARERETNPGLKAKLVANLPYYISTAVLKKLSERRHFLSEPILMFQREVVDRMTAVPGSSERGFLTVMTEAFFNVERLFDVPPGSFRPVPKIWSSVVRLTPLPGLPGREDKFRKLISEAFAQKRKTITNNLKGKYKDHMAALETAGIEPVRRAETLTLEEWLRLFDAVCPEPLSGPPNMI